MGNLSRQREFILAKQGWPTRATSRGTKKSETVQSSLDQNLARVHHKLYLPLPPGPPRMTRPRGAPLTGGRPRKKLPLPRPMFGGLGPSGGQDSGSSCIPSGPAPKEVVGAWLSFGDILKSCSSSVGGPSHFLFSPIGGGGPIAGPNFMSSRD